MSKLIVSCGTLQSGGAERVLSVLASRFADKYDEVIYLTWIDLPDFYSIDNRIKRICIERECHSSFLPQKVIWFRKWIKRQNPTVLLSFLEPFNMMICCILMDTKIPIVVANRTDPRFACPRLWQRALRWISYKRADGILFQTDRSRNYFDNYIKKNSSVIYNPVFLPSRYRGLALGTEKRKSIVTVGRLEPVKNQAMLIKAFAEFEKKHPEYTLTIYGEGPYRSVLENLILRLDLKQKVFLPGAKKDLWDRICDARCFVLTSDFEGMPNALIEAMCLGLPCISTPVAGATDFIEDGVNGSIVNHNDIKKLSELLEQYTSDERLSSLIGNHAIQLYDRLTLDIISKKWIEYLVTVVNNK